jgi:hypothetical protein
MNSANSLTGAGIQDQAVTASVKDALRLGRVGVGFTICPSSGPAAGRGGASGPPTTVILAVNAEPSRTVGRWPLASVPTPRPVHGAAETRPFGIDPAPRAAPP